MVLYFQCIFCNVCISLVIVVLRKGESKPSLMTPAVHVFFSNPRNGMLPSYGEDFPE